MSRGLLLRLFLVVALLVVAAMAGLYFLRPVVAVAAVRRGVAASAVPGTVTVRAERTYLLVADVAGRIVENSLKVGQKVAKGDVLARIDSKALEIEIAQTRAQLAAVERRIELGSTQQFNLEGAREQLAYREELLKKGITPASEVEAHRRTVRSIEQAIEIERNELEVRRADLNALLDGRLNMLAKTTLLSPIDGIVSRVDAFVGDLVGSGFSIAEVVSLTRIVDAKISEENFSIVEIGQGATVRLAGYGSEKFTGKISKLATTADRETQRYIVEITVDAEPEKLVPGMTGEVVITVNERANALLIPRPALIGDRVFVINDGRVSQRTVKVGFTALNQAEIAEGVDENDLVALDRLDYLRDGMRVRAQVAR